MEKQEQESGLVLSDTMQTIVNVRRTLAELARSKDATNQQKYYARQAVKALDPIIAEAVTG